MKKIKFLIVLFFCLSLSIDAVANQKGPSPRAKAVDMSLYEEDHEFFKAEIVFEEDRGIDISAEDLENTLMDAFAAR